MKSEHLQTSGCVGRLACGEESGTAFLVTPSIAVATAHSVIDNLDSDEPIVVHFLGDRFECTVLTDGPSLASDLVLLELNRPASSRGLPVRATHLPKGIVWDTYGYPTAASGNGHEVAGTVATSRIPDVVWDLELEALHGSLTNYEGLSGAPVLVSGVVVAVVQQQVGGRLGAVSMYRMKAALDSHEVPYQGHRTEPLPTNVLEQLSLVEPNHETHQRLEEAILEADNSLITVHGPPGSGKTIVAASFQPLSDGIRVVGRYLMTSNAPRHFDYFCQPSVFVEWLAMLAAQRGSPAVTAGPSLDQRRLTEAMGINLETIARHATDRGHTALLFVDGIDASGPPSSSGAAALFAILPSTLPTNVRIVFTCSNPDDLDEALRDRGPSSRVRMTPLPTRQCEHYVAQNTDARLDIGEIATLAQALNGNPLLMALATAEIRNAPEDELERVVAQVSATGGDTSVYYRNQWSRLRELGHERLVLAVLARAREPIPHSEIIATLPDSAAMEHTEGLRRIVHLLRGTKQAVDFYHRSFADFVLKETEPLDARIHGWLAHYCESSDTRFANIHRVHHRIHSTASSNTAQLESCNQEWLVAATSLAADPAHVMSDIQGSLELALGAGDLVESVRILLLWSRAKYMLDFLFLANAEAVATIVSHLHGPDAGMGYAIRSGVLLLSTSDANRLLWALIVAGEGDTASRLLAAVRSREWARMESGQASLADLGPFVEALALAPLVDGPAALSELSAVFDAAEYAIHSLGLPDEEANAFRAEIRSRAAFAQVRVSGHFLCGATKHVDTPLVFLGESLLVLASAPNAGLTLAAILGGEDSRTPATPVPPHLRRWTLDELAVKLDEMLVEHDVPDWLAPLALEHVAGRDQDGSVFDTLTNCVLDQLDSASFRQENGVDLNEDALEATFLRARLSEPRDDTEDEPRRVCATRHPWEQRILDAARCLGHLDRIPLDSVDDTHIQESVRSFLCRNLWKLEERVGWEDSYALPEHALPWLIDRLIAVSTRRAPSALPLIVDEVAARAPDQLGVYTEGFVRTLHRVGFRLYRRAEFASESRRVFEIASQHTRERVFARLERVGALLDQADGLLHLGEHEKASELYTDVIGSSMGPTWYKEAQFRLAVDALDAVDDRTFTAEHWIQTVKILELASGDSTFQRYVRFDKESLVGHLARAGMSAEAVSLVKHYCWPDDAVQLARLERAPTDAPTPYLGSRFGTNEVDEQGAVLQLMGGLEGASRERRWTLVELFAPGDDRHREPYARRMGKLLSDDPDGALRHRWARSLSADYSPDDVPIWAAKVLATGAPEEAAKLLLSQHALQGALPADWKSPSPAGDQYGGGQAEPEGNSLGEPEGNEPNRPELLLDGVFGTQETWEALEVVLSQPSGATPAEIMSTLLAAQKGGWGLWTSGGAPDDALRHLCSLDPNVGLPLMAPLILAEKHVLPWRMAAVLVEHGSRPATADQRVRLFGAIAQHLECLLGPEMTHCHVSFETEVEQEASSSESDDDVIDGLLVDLLDHPNPMFVERVADNIVWLATVSPGTVVRRLAERVSSADGTGFGREVAAGVLAAIFGLGVSVDAPVPLRPKLSEPNVLVRGSIVSVPAEYVEETPTQDASETVESRQKALFYEWTHGARRYLRGVSPPVAAAALTALESLSGTLTPATRQKLHALRMRAARISTGEIGTPLEREALFSAIGRASQSDWNPKLVRAALCNRRWPRQHMTLGPVPTSRGILEHLRAGDYDRAFRFEGQFILHFHSIELEQDGRTSLECAAVLVANGVPGSIVVPRRDCPTAWPNDELAQPRQLVLPAPSPTVRVVDRFQVAALFGGGMTPALLTPEALRLFAAYAESTRYRFWARHREDSPQAMGRHLTSGVSTTISAPKLAVGGYRLVWVVWLGGSHPRVVDPAIGHVWEVTGED